MKYKIKLGGRGADIWVHDINEEQKKLLKEGSVESDQMEMDDISKILNVEMVDESDEIFTGVYDESDAIVIEVKNETGDVIFDSTNEESWYFDDDTMMDNDNYDSVHEGDNKFFVESYSKGNFFEFELECEEFNPTKLSPQLVEIGERFQLITGLYYDGKELEKEFDDYWGKGYYYHLS